MDSIWTKEAVDLPVKKITDKVRADVIIVGGGLSGLLCAYYLRDSGLSVIVIEKDHIGRGVTGNTTGKITSQHGLFYSPLYDKGKKDAARQYGSYQERAIREYGNIIKRERISCDFLILDSYLYSTVSRNEVKREAEVAKLLGIKGEYQKQLSLPFETKGAAVFHDQAQFHPIKFLKGISKDLDIYQESPVTAIKGHEVTVFHEELGKEVIAYGERIIIAAHFPIINFPGMYFAKMYQDTSYILALKNAPHIGGMYKDAATSGYSLRNHQEFLLFGGSAHRSGQMPDRNPAEALRSAARQYFPEAAEAALWSAADCMPLRGIPFIGPYSRVNEYTYVASGYQKWGMTNAMVAAILLSQTILENRVTKRNIFHPASFQVTPPLKKLLSHTGITAKNLIFPAKGPRCTHLGCRLTWNPIAQTYDCPCHGSRFHKKGGILTNPTLKPLKNRK